MISVLVIPADSARPPHLEVVEPYHEMIMNLCGGDLEPSDYTLSDDGPDKAELWAHPFAIEDSLVNDRANAIIGLFGVGPDTEQAPLYGDAVLTGVDPTSVIPVYYDAPDLYRQLLTADLLQVHIQHTPTSTWIAHSEGHRSFLDAYQAVEELTGVPQVRLRVTPAQDIPPIR